MPHGHDAAASFDDRYRSADLDVDLVGLIGGGESRRGDFSGIRGLMLAVLDDAIVVYLSRPGRARDEAEAWIESEQRRSPFAFVVICETLGLEAEPVRTVLRRWREQDLPPRRALGRTRGNVQTQSELRARVPQTSRKRLVGAAPRPGGGQ